MMIIGCSLIFILTCLAFLELLRVARRIGWETRKTMLLVIFCGLFLSVLLTLNHLKVFQLIDWRIMLGIAIVLNVLDWHSTLLSKNKHGVEESNNAVRPILKKGNKSFSLYKLLFGSILISFVFYVNRDYFPLQAAISFLFIVVVLRNYIICYK